MNKRTVIIMILVLALVVGIFAFINKDMVKDKEEIHENAEILISDSGKEVKLTFRDIKDLREKDFVANLKSSGKPAKEHKYTGVPLKSLFERADIDIKDNNQLSVKAIDGYTVALGVDEVLENDNIYLAYKIDGKPLGNKEDGGSGPYQIIIRKDQFSQRWCKHAVEIEIND